MDSMAPRQFRYDEWEDSGEGSAAAVSVLIEAKFMQAIPQLRDTNCIRAITTWRGVISWKLGRWRPRQESCWTWIRSPVKYPGADGLGDSAFRIPERMLWPFPGTS